MDHAARRPGVNASGNLDSSAHVNYASSFRRAAGRECTAFGVSCLYGLGCVRFGMEEDPLTIEVVS